MAAGLSSANLANKWLNMLRGVAFPSPPGATLYIALHKGDPGAAGTANASVNTTRVALVLGAPANGTVALTGSQPTWTMSATETLSHISVWDASTAGNFLWSAALTATRTVNNLDTFTLTACGLSLSPIAV